MTNRPTTPIGGAGRRATAAVLLASAALAACDREPEVARPCDPIAAVDTTGWTRQAASDSLHTFLLPPSFVRTDPTPIPGARARWADRTRPERAIEEIVSVWTHEALRPRRAEVGLAYLRCNPRIDGRRNLVVSRYDGSEYTITAWFIPAAAADTARADTARADSAHADSAADTGTVITPSLLLDMRGPERADQDVFLAIVRSAKRIARPGP